MIGRNGMQSVNKIGCHVGTQLMKLEAEERIDELYMKRAEFIMNSDSCEFVKQLALSENRKEHKESKNTVA